MTLLPIKPLLSLSNKTAINLNFISSGLNMLLKMAQHLFIEYSHSSPAQQKEAINNLCSTQSAMHFQKGNNVLISNSLKKKFCIFFSLSGQKVLHIFSFNVSI